MKDTDAWTAECIAYWSQFDPTAKITEDMIANQPVPPADSVLDIAANTADILARTLHYQRTGERGEPSVQARLDVADLLDTAVENAESGMGAVTRFEESARLWDQLIDGEDA